jgi:hypothetical protein
MFSSILTNHRQMIARKSMFAPLKAIESQVINRWESVVWMSLSCMSSNSNLLDKTLGSVTQTAIEPSCLSRMSEKLARIAGENKPDVTFIPNMAITAELVPCNNFRLDYGESSSVALPLEQGQGRAAHTQAHRSTSACMPAHPSGWTPSYLETVLVLHSASARRALNSNLLAAASNNRVLAPCPYSACPNIVVRPTTDGKHLNMTWRDDGCWVLFSVSPCSSHNVHSKLMQSKRCLGSTRALNACKQH